MGSTGATTGPGRYRIEDLPERIAAKISINPETGCWEWQGWRSHDGYGYVFWEGKDRSAHRTVFQLLVGPIPDGRTLDHVHARGCRSKACCWPVHLEPTTTAENTRRFWGGAPNPETHCRHGHERTPGNTYTTRDGYRECRPCRLLEKARRPRRKAG